MSIAIVKDSILNADTDCIVNPANLFLRHGAGLARIIADAAAPSAPAASERHRLAQAWRAEQARTPTIATGDVAVTSAGALPFKGIIHAVGPVWEDGTFYERELLERVHARACRVALQHGWESIAFPAISCGLFRFPASQAAPCAISGVYGFTDLDVKFYLLDSGHVSAWTSALDSLT